MNTCTRAQTHSASDQMPLKALYKYSIILYYIAAIHTYKQAYANDLDLYPKTLIGTCLVIDACKLEQLCQALQIVLCKRVHILLQGLGLRVVFPMTMKNNCHSQAIHEIFVLASHQVQQIQAYRRLGLHEIPNAQLVPPLKSTHYAYMYVFPVLRNSKADAYFQLNLPAANNVMREIIHVCIQPIKLYFAKTYRCYKLKRGIGRGRPGHQYTHMIQQYI